MGSRRVVLGIAGLALALAVALVARAMRPAPPLGVFGAVPEFRFVDERGAPFSNATMAGHVAVVDFVFTHCTSSCPRLTKRMGELQSRLARDGSDARLVSFSVDPENDTPPVLAAYAAKAGADLGRWTFVTGPADDVTKVVVQGFKMSAAKVAKGAADYDVVHGDWFVLVDRQGRIRGYYATDDPDGMTRVGDDAERLDRGKS